MSADEWKAAYVKRFLAGPWDEKNEADTAEFRAVAQSMADAAYEDDHEADPEGAAYDELLEWVD
jgi:hypothetical protein